MQEHDQPHSGWRQFVSGLAHRLLPGGRLSVGGRRPIRIGEPIAGIFAGEFVVLEIIFDRHGKSVLPETEWEVQWSDRGGVAKFL